MHIIINDFDDKIHLSSFTVHLRLVEAGSVSHLVTDNWDEGSALSFIHRHFSRSCEIGVLRSAIAPDVYDVTRMNNHEVMKLAALNLQNGSWQRGYEPAPVVKRLTNETAALIAAARPMEISVPRRLRVDVPRMAPTPARIPRVPDATAIDAATPTVPEWSNETDQVAFAMVLERAAKNVNPFCEICAAKAIEPLVAPV